MRYCMILILFVCLGFVSYYNFKITTIEREIYFLYSNNFMDFFVVDNDSKISINAECLEKYLLNQGYNSSVKFENGDLTIVVCIDGIMKRERIYSFYMEKNYEYK